MSNKSLHPTLHPENVSSYSSLVSALEDHRVRGSFVEDTFRVPRTSSGSLLRPLPAWAGQITITFDTVQGLFGGRGLPLAFLQSGMAPGGILRHASDHVFANRSPGSVFNIRLSWPGYSQVECVTGVPIPSPATRVDVAVAVIGQYSQLIARAELEGPREKGREGWKLGRGAITIENLILVSVSNGQDGVFEAEIHVVLTRNDPMAMLAALRR
ncbi:uncharacterized protein B0H18DRAFT_1122334 [Fomitopsis serialis]|uniref:uncharacterized protein n=1 Tax=Fomitopsis serialis TaxID=139415 RepID=UPI00200783BD|nr:uncharacterized protein B0H18DRAFT_1122334 [Neoantrodia serialis]KAH9919688.1 hypothetical protein B0H18DRAFT_1122334 [Neoantrodia serialis]